MDLPLLQLPVIQGGHHGPRQAYIGGIEIINLLIPGYLFHFAYLPWLLTFYGLNKVRKII